MNRRRMRRKRLRISIQMEPGRITSYSGDLSATGVFVHSSRVHRPGTRVRLVLRTSGGPIEAEGVVRWARRVPPQFVSHVRGGMGVEFVEPSAELMAFLRFAVPWETEGSD